MTYGYVLTLAARDREAVSILDWGSGIGHYLPLSRTLLPGVQIDYVAADLPELCRVGRELQPEATFLDDSEQCFDRRYDLVLVSGSLQYAENWKQLLSRLADASRGYVFVTRLPVVHRAASFVVVQRPKRFGYDTEYRGWFLNQAELLVHARSVGLLLVREFLVLERAEAVGAPESGEYKGFLFRSSSPSPATVG